MVLWSAHWSVSSRGTGYTVEVSHPPRDSLLGLTAPPGLLQPLGELNHFCLGLAALGPTALCLPPPQGPAVWSHGPLPTLASWGPAAFYFSHYTRNL